MDDLGEEGKIEALKGGNTRVDLRKKYCDELANSITEFLEYEPKIVDPETKIDELEEKAVKSLEEVADSMFGLEKEISDLGSTGLYPASKILKPREFDMITKWLPTKAQNKKWTQVYRYSNAKGDT
mmetsp:Transcript_31221/g.28396  ORF Transcript_31221/g.28396 Transcript_31221/m.28396 type:complete len:126 (+) Transcript_31221:629-1006(+)